MIHYYAGDYVLIGTGKFEIYKYQEYDYVNGTWYDQYRQVEKQVEFQLEEYDIKPIINFESIPFDEPCDDYHDKLEIKDRRLLISSFLSAEGFNEPIEESEYTFADELNILKDLLN